MAWIDAINLIQGKSFSGPSVHSKECHGKPFQACVTVYDKFTYSITHKYPITRTYRLCHSYGNSWFMFFHSYLQIWMKRVLNGIACTCGIAASWNKSSDFKKKRPSKATWTYFWNNSWYSFKKKEKTITSNKSTLLNRWNSENLLSFMCAFCFSYPYSFLSNTLRSLLFD